MQPLASAMIFAGPPVIPVQAAPTVINYSRCTVGLQALAGALDDELALELIDRAEDVEDQPPGRRGRVDLLPQDDQAYAALAQLVGEREQVLQRPHRAGQAGDDEHVAFAQVGQS